MRTKKVTVLSYDKGWKDDFAAIQKELVSAIGELILGIEHVGSTSVEGLSAKPCIDIDVVLPDYSVFDEAVRRLAAIGYQYEGDLGIPHRHAFAYRDKPHLQTHHLYLCPQFSPELHRHITFRDYLRTHPEAVKEYSAVKEEAARLFPDDIDRYIQHKSPCIQKIYTLCGLNGPAEAKGGPTMKKIIAVNGSPRTAWNTAQLIRKAAEGAQSAGAEIKVYDLYQLEPFTGCVSCFGCKLQPNLGKCVCRDGLSQLLEDIRTADGLILGSPNYLSDITAGLRALYERLVFQYITYKKEPRSYNDRLIPVLFVMTSNASAEMYDRIGYTAKLESYQSMLGRLVGETKVLVSADTLQVNDYDRYDWTSFDPEAKKRRRETVFPTELDAAFELGKEMVLSPWQK